MKSESLAAVGVALTVARRARRRAFAWTPARRALRRVRADVAALRPGDGIVVDVGGSPLALRREPDGSLTGLDAICPHDGACPVAFDRERNGWRCPRHGARFGPDGAVLRGPARTGLEPVDVSRLERRRVG